MISIIVPVYNVRPYLEQCICSIIGQSYRDWECILVDDGSTDGSGELCDELAHEDERLIVLHQENQGVSAARNHGLSICKGEYICFIDSDDWVAPDYLSHLLSGMTEDRVDMVVTGTIHEQTTVKVHTSKEIIRLRMEGDFTGPFIEHVGLFYGPCSILYKSSIIREHHILFPEKLSFGEDTTFVFSYLRLAKDIALLPFADYHYRIVDQASLSHRFGAEKTFLRYELWEMRKAFYMDKGMWNAISQKNMYRELWAIVYDGIYSTPQPTYSFLKSLLSIQEIRELGHWDDLFEIPRYIKYGIKHKAAWLFYLLRNFN